VIDAITTDASHAGIRTDIRAGDNLDNISKRVEPELGARTSPVDELRIPSGPWGT
jgi:hypothetical protein